MSLVFAALFSIFSGFAINAAPEKPLALIYKGPGSCETSGRISGCSEMAAEMASLAGYRTQFVGPTDHDRTLFLAAKLWIQPGGRARIQTQTMSSALKKQIVEFVKNGGGYVGFCAGGFLATEKFGWETKEGPFEATGLGLIRGKSFYYDKFDKELSETLLAKMIQVSWAGINRWIYWELGPYFTQESLDGTRSTAVAHYPRFGDDDAPILAIRGYFGRGRFFVSATHPEAPNSWREFYGIEDPDGVDFDHAVEMIRWTTLEN